MPEFGLTTSGFKRKRYSDVLASMEARARNLFGENVNLSERSPLGLFIRIVAWSIGILWQAAEAVYNAAFVDTATGHDLDRVALYIGASRRPAEKATGEVTFLGDNDTVVPSGFLVATADDIAFETTEAVSITAGTATVSIRAVETGTSGNVPAETITEIINPAAGIDSVTNAEPTTGGRNRETDAELRARYALSVAKGGASTIDSIRASLLELEGVRAALVKENNTMTPDAEGRPPKSIQCYVLGGDETDIAKTVLQTKAAGIQAYGTPPTNAIEVQDNAGQTHLIGFTFTEIVQIYVNVILTVSVAYPLDGQEKVITNIVKYIGGVDTDGTLYTGLGMGQNVVLSKIIDVCYNVVGVEDVSVELSTDGVIFAASNVIIPSEQVAETEHAKVVINYV